MHIKKVWPALVLRLRDWAQMMEIIWNSTLHASKIVSAPPHRINKWPWLRWWLPTWGSHCGSGGGSGSSRCCSWESLCYIWPALGWITSPGKETETLKKRNNIKSILSGDFPNFLCPFQSWNFEKNKKSPLASNTHISRHMSSYPILTAQPKNEWYSDEELMEFWPSFTYFLSIESSAPLVRQYAWQNPSPYNYLSLLWNRL